MSGTTIVKGPGRYATSDGLLEALQVVFNVDESAIFERAYFADDTYANLPGLTSVVYRIPSTVCCLLSAVCCLLFVVYCLTSAAPSIHRRLSIPVRSIIWDAGGQSEADRGAGT
jgi:hypothetical protein